jgi:hypothetical protein
MRAGIRQAVRALRARRLDADGVDPLDAIADTGVAAAA